MSKVLHVVGLSGYGGLEQLFVAYLGALPAGSPRPAVAVKQDVHPDFRPRLRTYPGTVYRQKYWGSLRLPGLPVCRRLNLSRIVRAAAADKIVFWSTLPGADWVRACRRSGTAIVYYDHGRAWQLNREAAAPLRHAGSAIAVSEAGRRILQERLGFSGPVAVVPNGVRFPSDPAPSPAAPEGPLRLGFAGRLVDKKGVPLLLRAAKRLDERGLDFTLAIAGDGPAREPLRELTRDLGLSERVRFLGQVRDMPKFYRSIELLVMPSLQEPFGLTALEAAAHGVPAVVTRVDGLAGTVVDGETGFSLPATLPMSSYLELGGGWFEVPEQVYDPDTDTLRTPAIVDPAVLADLLAQLASKRDRLQIMGRRAAEHTAAEFCMARYAERLNGVLGRH